MKHTILGLFGLTAGLAQAAILVSPVTVTNDTGFVEFFPLNNIINGSGLSATPDFSNYTTVTHAAAGAGTAWTTDAPNGGTGDYFDPGGTGITPTVTLDLGGTFELSDFVYWGYHFGAPNGNEVREFSLEFSTDGGGSYGAPVVVSSALGDHTVAAARTLSLGGTFTADTVRATFTDNHFGVGQPAGGDRAGLGELRFVAVPEPSTVLLGGLALLGLARRKR